MLHGKKEIRLYTCFIKTYRKNSLAIFFSFALTFLLLTVILTLTHTNHRIANIQFKAEMTPSDCYIKDLTEQQTERLAQDPEIKWTALQQGNYRLYERNGQKVFVTRNDQTAVTMMSKLIDGRLPEKEGEIAAEKWVLLNLGIEPVIHQEVTVTDEETKEEVTWELAGILSDTYSNKKYGVLNLYSAMDGSSTDPYLAYLGFQDTVNYDRKVRSLIKELGIEEQQVKECPAREDFHELYRNDVGMAGVLLLICLVVFYGVYRITLLSRMGQYGILRAVGMKKRQVCGMLLRELWAIFWVSVPAGILGGLFAAWLVMLLSGDRSAEVYLLNEAVTFSMVIPVTQILCCILAAFLLVSLTGYVSGRKILSAPVIEMISGKETETKSRLFSIRRADSKTGTLLRMSCKYIFKDLPTSGFAVLTICMGITLFTALAYQAETLEQYREDTREMYYLNGDYALTMLYFDHVNAGISREQAEKIKTLEGIGSVKTSSGLPVRVIDESGVKRNDAYYEEHDQRLEELYGYSDSGSDGKNQIYKSRLLGYNTDALQALQKYVIEGAFEADGLKDDEVILSVLRMDDTKHNSLPGYYKEGTPLMEYHAGDEITIKYRQDLRTDSVIYERLEDRDAKYTYKTYRIAAVVSFSYMYDCMRTIYPLLITSDRCIREIAPASGIQCMYCDGSPGMDGSRQSQLEQQLIRIGSGASEISTRSLISEKKQNEMYYHKQMVYIYGISVITFILVLINIINNFRYRMQKRTREICMLRAIGMSAAMTKRIMMFENLILGALSIGSALLLLQPVLRYLYRMSDMQAFGHKFHFAYAQFLLASAGALLLCVTLSFGILKEWKTRQIINGIGNFE